MHAARHSVVLLATLFLVFAVVPFIDGEGPQRRGILVSLIFNFVLLGAVYDLSGRRRTLVIGLCLIVPAILGSTLGVFLGSVALRLTGSVLFAVALTYMLWVLVARLLAARQVNTNTICAAVSGYLVLGILWMVLYNILRFVDQDCIRGLASVP